MTCEHKRIKSVNCVLFCLECGAELPADWLTGKHTPASADAPEGAKEAEKTASAKTRRKKG